MNLPAFQFRNFRELMRSACSPGPSPARSRPMASAMSKDRFRVKRSKSCQDEIKRPCLTALFLMDLLFDFVQPDTQRLPGDRIERGPLSGQVKCLLRVGIGFAGRKE